MIANWTLSIISCYLACFAHRFSSYVAFFSRTSAGSLPRARARVLAWLMPQGSVLLLGLIGIEGARIFREICFVATIRLAKTKISTFVQLFCDYGLPSVLCKAEMGRRASDLPLFRASIRVLTLRDNSQSQKSCNFGRISVFGHLDRPHAGVAGGGVPGAAPLWTTWSTFCPLWSRVFSLAASEGALALVPSQRQLHCGIMIRTVSKEL